MPLIDKLEDYSSCAIWLEGFKSKSTKRVYTIHVLLFCRFCAVTPDQLIKIESGQLKIMVLNYIVNLKRIAKQIAGKPKPGSLSVNSIKHYVTGIQSFLEFHEIILPWKKIAKFFDSEYRQCCSIYTRSENNN